MLKKQRGAVSGALVGLLAVLSLVILTVLVAAMSYISANNSANAMEQQIKAEYENNKNVLSGYTQKIAEAAQVPDMMRDDLQKVVTGAIQARYGEEGSKATMQWLKEQNPQLDPQIYRKLQQIIEAGRDEFKNSQTRLIDVKRNYETSLGNFWSGMWMRIAGYPKINLADFKVVTTDKVEDAFKKGREEGPVQLRKTN